MSISSVGLLQDEEKGRVPFPERLTCSVADAVAATGLSKSYLYLQMNAGKLQFHMQGKRRLVVVPSLRRLIGDGA